MNQNIRIQRSIAILAVIVFAIKITAWYLTRSVAVYTDALESVVNVATGFLGLYSVWLSARPRDQNHPYGHGKVEYLSAAIEGILIIIAGLVIIAETIKKFITPQPLLELNWGILLVSSTALINGGFGWYAKHYGQKNHSIAIESGGRHLLSDTYSTLGMLAGLVIIKITGIQLLDTLIAAVFALVIIYSGYTVLRKSLAGIMDEANMKLLKQLIAHINTERQADWIDLHNLRTIQYGNILHIDAHMTVPWYYNVLEAHETIGTLEHSIRKKFGNQIELFIHTDACTERSCRLCALDTCAVRQHPFGSTVEWTLENVLTNKQHKL